MLESSIIRDLDKTLYSNTEVIALSGARPRDLLSTLNDKKEKGQKYEKNIVASGGNQLNYKDLAGDPNIPEAVADMKKVIQVAKSISDNVMLCELPSRIHTDNAANVITKFNVDLEKLAQNENCKLIRTSQCFHLADGTPNDGYVDNDKVHLNMPGSAKLVQCMDLQLKDTNGKNVNMAAYKKTDKSSSKPKKKPSWQKLICKWIP